MLSARGVGSTKRVYGCVYIYNTYICVYVYIIILYDYICVYEHVYVHVCVHVFVHVYVHVYMNMYMYDMHTGSQTVGFASLGSTCKLLKLNQDM